jgi:hypothetical protein
MSSNSSNIAASNIAAFMFKTCQQLLSLKAQGFADCIASSNVLALLQ